MPVHRRRRNVPGMAVDVHPEPWAGSLEAAARDDHCRTVERFLWSCESVRLIAEIRRLRVEVARRDDALADLAARLPDSELPAVTLPAYRGGAS